MDIDKAKQRVRDHQKRLAEERERNKPSINEKMAEEAKPWINSYDFWCEECDEDFKSEAQVCVHRLYGEPIITYRAEHDCGEECVRLVSHRDNDPYYYLSDRVNAQRNEYYVDMLQADQLGFKTHWGEPFGEYYERLKVKEERLFNHRKDQGLEGQSLAEINRLKQMRKM